MKIVIAGAGEVGFHLAYDDKGAHIVVIDKNKERLRYIESHIDVITIRGDASSPKVLDEARAETADLLISVTDSETNNFCIAILGKKFGAKKL